MFLVLEQCFKDYQVRGEEELLCVRPSPQRFARSYSTVCQLRYVCSRLAAGSRFVSSVHHHRLYSMKACEKPDTDVKPMHVSFACLDNVNFCSFTSCGSDISAAGLTLMLRICRPRGVRTWRCAPSRGNSSPFAHEFWNPLPASGHVRCLVSNDQERSFHSSTLLFGRTTNRGGHGCQRLNIH